MNLRARQPLEKAARLIFRALLLFFLCTAVSCGYHHPYATKNDAKPLILYRSMWENKTNELALESRFFHTLSTWLRRSKLIQLTESPKTARYTIAGSITSIELPEISYGSNNTATEFRAKVGVSYQIIDQETDQTVLDQSRIYSETFHPNTNSAQLHTNKNEALDAIADDISEDIYLFLINKLL